LHREQRRLSLDGVDCNVGARAFDLLLALVGRRGELVRKAELIDAVWPDMVVEENNLHVQISNLRRLLGPTVIATIPGYGYRFTAELAGVGDEERRAPAHGSNPAGPTANAPTTTNLPVQLLALYGRDADESRLHALIGTHTLVSVVGSGGIGKTALAQAVAHRLQGSFEDGVWQVELAPLADGSLVAATVAGTLHLAVGEGDPTQGLARALATSRMLILLDNCEHLVESVAALAAAIHRMAPNVRLLTTSQVPLKLAQENVFRLEALALPTGDDLDGARQAGAVALFEARAHAADPRFALGQDNLAAVVDICRRLDGIALAIELAAARVPLFGVDALRAKLNEDFRVLASGARLAPPRQQTLRAALEWSHGLLTPDEQAVFRRLGVCAGGFGVETAQRVAARGGLDEWAVLEHLGALIDKSLVVAETRGEPRYRLLESNRAFALDMLRASGEIEAARRSHAEAVLATFEESRRNEYLLSTQARLDRYLPDLDNARAALEWSAGPRGEASLHIALAGAIAWIWVAVDLRPEGVRRTRAAIDAIEPDTPPHLQARLLASWPWLSHPIVGPQEIATNARAIEIFRRLGDRQMLYSALCVQARFLPYLDRLGEAELAVEEAESLFDPSWPPRTRLPLLRARSFSLMVQGRCEECFAVEEEVRQLANALDDRKLLMNALVNMEQCSMGLGRVEEAVARGRALVELMRQDHSLRHANEHVVLKNLQMSLTLTGAGDEALEVARSVYGLFQRLDRAPELLEPFALMACMRGRTEDAARVLGCADKSYATIDTRRDPVEKQIRARLESRLRSALTAQDLQRLAREGEALRDEAALRLALGEWQAESTSMAVREANARTLTTGQ
jgi:predicted ATPase/DNA-binding winged helix-turn-helix (wHTH) protein